MSTPPSASLQRAAEAVLARDPDRLLALFFLAWRGFAAEPDAILEHEGLGRVHHRVLYAVVRIPGIKVGELATTLGISRQALHSSLSELVDRKLVKSTVSPTSRRERQLHVTKRGATLEDRASGVQRKKLAKIFAASGRSATAGWMEVMQSLAASVMSGSPGLLAQIVATERP